MPVLQANSSRPAPFDLIARVYDDVFTDSAIGRAQRGIVWNEMDRVFHSGQRILEINCGTGIDALYLASRGVEVVACDSSPGMIARAQQRAASSVGARVRIRCVPTEELNKLVFEGPYDGVLSNFSGLDCISNLEPVARNLAALVRPGGKAVLCVFGSFCLWEMLWYLSAGKPGKAFRRFHRKGVSAAPSPGAPVTVHYRSVRSLRKTFAPYFRLERWRGVGVVSPPSYAAPVAARFPRLFRFAVASDRLLGRLPAFRSVADHVVLTFERVREGGSG